MSWVLQKLWHLENCYILVREKRGLENGDSVNKGCGKNSSQMSRKAGREHLKERRKTSNMPGVQCQEFGPKDCGIKLYVLACHHYANSEDEEGWVCTRFQEPQWDRMKSRSFRSWMLIFILPLASFRTSVLSCRNKGRNNINLARVKTIQPPTPPKKTPFFFFKNYTTSTVGIYSTDIYFIWFFLHISLFFLYWLHVWLERKEEECSCSCILILSSCQKVFYCCASVRSFQELWTTLSCYSPTGWQNGPVQLVSHHCFPWLL